MLNMKQIISIYWISKIKFIYKSLDEEGTDSISHGYIITDISGKF